MMNRMITVMICANRFTNRSRILSMITFVFMLAVGVKDFREV